MRIYFYICESNKLKFYRHETQQSKNLEMEVFNIEKLDECVQKHSSSKKALNKFIEILDNADIGNHSELLKIFPKADYVGNNRYVFDIKGNNFRVVCVVVFVAGTVFVRFAGTHAEYDKINAATI